MEINELSRPFHTSAKEKTVYKLLIGMGLLLAMVSLTLEVTAVPNPHDLPFWMVNHGFWTLFALVGLGIASVFGYILSQAQDRLGEA